MTVCTYAPVYIDQKGTKKKNSSIPRCFVAPSWCLDLDPNLPKFQPKLAMRPHPRFEEPEVHSGASWPTWQATTLMDLLAKSVGKNGLFQCD